MRVYPGKTGAFAVNEFGETAEITGVDYMLLLKQVKERQLLSPKRKTTIMAEIVSSWSHDRLNWHPSSVA